NSMTDSNHTTDVAAIYFPSWHPNDHYSAWHGKDFTEWELVRTTQPLFEGHHQPKEPSWGYFDESDPQWSAKEIDLAADHGITAFLFDWYWYSGVQIMEEALERGFLRAPNRQRLKFALMWANHSWGTWPARTGVPGMYPHESDIAGGFLPIRHDLEGLDRVTDYCCEHYFNEPNYWRIDDRPVFSFFDVTKFTQDLGGIDGGRRALDRMRDRAVTNGLPGLYFAANIACTDDNEYCVGWDRVPDARQMGFETVFAYNIVRTPQSTHLPRERPLVEYDDVIRSHAYCFDKIEAGGVHHMPVVTFGCDVTPRWHRGVTLPYDYQALNYEPIIVGNTPEKFGELCRIALDRARATKLGAPAIVINAWNEWTEGMYLLPEKRYGTQYLEALRDAIDTTR
ncbi:MAG: glycoside hydrolase family 99-like domain-containing protein, partial [Phycisphaeraceae bacterium]|nr:glycoside hydrolase family 99-like domain-containing protein [Phycisphaeraceae bacterium]